MTKTRTTIHPVLATLLLLAGTAQASEKADLFPGQANWHRYGFVVVPNTQGGEVAVRQVITLLWDDPGTGVLVSVVDPTSTTAPLLGVSSGNDRMVSLELGLVAGSYEIWVSGVLNPTHYHMNVTYGVDELLFRRPDGGPFSAARQVNDLRIEEILAPHVARLKQAVRQAGQ